MTVLRLAVTPMEASSILTGLFPARHSLSLCYSTVHFGVHVEVLGTWDQELCMAGTCVHAADYGQSTTRTSQGGPTSTLHNTAAKLQLEWGTGWWDSGDMALGFIQYLLFSIWQGSRAPLYQHGRWAGYGVRTRCHPCSRLHFPPWDVS